MRFSGHDTFHCREHWILKGIQFVKENGEPSSFSAKLAPVQLGVGKNMVKSIQYWLRAFNILCFYQNTYKLSDFVDYIFTQNFDKYLEHPSSLWLLHYNLCFRKYASLYSLIFNDFFRDRLTSEFSENQVLNFVHRKLIEEGVKPKPSDNTLKTDFKVFVKTYLSPKKNIKTIEDDFGAPLIGLYLLEETNGFNDYKQPIYRLNRGDQNDLCPYIFAYCLIESFWKENTVSLNDIFFTIGGIFCLNQTGFEAKVKHLCHLDSRFVLKQDAGLKQLQIKGNQEEIKRDLITKAYLEDA